MKKVKDNSREEPETKRTCEDEVGLVQNMQQLDNIPFNPKGK